MLLKILQWLFTTCEIIFALAEWVNRNLQVRKKNGISCKASVGRPESVYSGILCEEEDIKEGVCHIIKNKSTEVVRTNDEI